MKKTLAVSAGVVAAGALLLLLLDDEPGPAMCWDTVPDVASYRVYWSDNPTEWPAGQFAEFDNTNCGPDECCVEWTDPAGTIIYYNVVACREDLCSVWDHGEVVP